MKYIALAIALLLPSVSHAADIRDLPKEEYVFQALHAADMAQTMYSINHLDNFVEVNPILGRNPSNEKIAVFFVGTGLLHAATTLYLMDHYPQYVKRWEHISIGVKGAAIVWNYTVILK